MKNQKYLYKNFLVNKRVYNLNSGYWKRVLISKLDIKFSIENQYVINKKPNGKSFYDGNPIFSYVENNKAFRIIQEDPKEIVDLNEIRLIDAWFDNLYTNGKDNPIKELVISLYLTKSTVDKCIELIRLYRLDKLTDINIDNYL